MSQPFWCCANVITNRSDLVVTLLRREGYEVYAPRIRMPQKRTGMLFPGYVFVRVFTIWSPVRWTPGVTRLLMTTEDRPARVPDAVIAEIRSREVRGFVKLPKPPGALEVGQRVRITNGMFTGKLAIYQGQSNAERERVLLELLGGQLVPMILPVGSVEAVR
jgi:transcriptional antiterminator RfaH